MATKKTPLKISCTATDCASNLHCFKAKKKVKSGAHKGTCRACGVALVAWDRVHKRDLDDVANTFAALKHELIRHHFWHVGIDQRAVNHARRKGRRALYSGIEKRIEMSIGKANPYRDGRQTPKEGNAVYYAQHATASCCRRCAEYWHNIPVGRPLSADEVTYLAGLARLYLDERLPDLAEEGVKVPAIRTPKTPVDDKPGDEQAVEQPAKPLRSIGRAVEKRSTTADRASETARRTTPPRREPKAH